jgi:hypothetical protein
VELKRLGFGTPKNSTGVEDIDLELAQQILSVKCVI